MISRRLISHSLVVLLAMRSSLRADAVSFVQQLPGTQVSFKMVPIPSGAFAMGSPDTEPHRNADEGPQHTVKVEAFFIEEHEVTWAEYYLFLANFRRLGLQQAQHHLPPIPEDKLADAVTYPTPMYHLEIDPVLAPMGGSTTDRPAVMPSQFAARQYTKWLSKKTGRFYRLPSEAEWEYAARAGTKTAYFFGDDPAKLGDYAWFKSNSVVAKNDTGYHAIMTKKPNPWGLYDMYGNAMEWCVDLYQADAYAHLKQEQNPVNWAEMTKSPYPRVLRGGNYDSDAQQCRSASRLPSNQLMNGSDGQLPRSPHWMSSGFDIGFRVVSPAKEPPEVEKNKWWNADDATTLKTIQRPREQHELVLPGPIPDK